MRFFVHFDTLCLFAPLADNPETIENNKMDEWDGEIGYTTIMHCKTITKIAYSLVEFEIMWKIDTVKIGLYRVNLPKTLLNQL